MTAASCLTTLCDLCCRLMSRLALYHVHTVAMATERLQPLDLVCGTRYQSSCPIRTSLIYSLDDSSWDTFWASWTRRSVTSICSALEKHWLTYLLTNHLKCITIVMPITTASWLLLDLWNKLLQYQTLLSYRAVFDSQSIASYFAVFSVRRLCWIIVTQWNSWKRQVRTTVPASRHWNRKYQSGWHYLGAHRQRANVLISNMINFLIFAGQGHSIYIYY